MAKRLLLLLIAAASHVGPAARAGAGPVLVITSSGTEAYAQALEGIRATMTATTEVVDLTVKEQSSNLTQAVTRTQPRLIIAVGAEALKSLPAGAAGVPVIATMILQSDTYKDEGAKLSRNVAGTVSLDLPVAVVCREWKRLVPGKARLGIIRNPAKNGTPGSVLEAQAASAGCSVRIVECTRAEEFLPAFLSLRGSVDVVWCLPDSTLYTSATVKPLLMGSLEHQLPVIGFSESFVRAGAVAGFYPDYGDVGRQTGEMAMSWLAGEPVGRSQAPRAVRLAFNSRVARLMGLHATAAREQDSRVLVLR